MKSSKLANVCHKGAEKVATAAGEAYFESILPAFIGRVGNHEVQIETTIEPVPREAMIAVGLRIMETLARNGCTTRGPG
jgi:hypothetical protein